MVTSFPSKNNGALYYKTRCLFELLITIEVQYLIEILLMTFIWHLKIRSSVTNIPFHVSLKRQSLIRL